MRLTATPFRPRSPLRRRRVPWKWPGSSRFSLSPCVPSPVRAAEMLRPEVAPVGRPVTLASSTAYAPGRARGASGSDFVRFEGSRTHCQRRHLAARRSGRSRRVDVVASGDENSTDAIHLAMGHGAAQQRGRRRGPRQSRLYRPHDDAQTGRHEDGNEGCQIRAAGADSNLLDPASKPRSCEPRCHQATTPHARPPPEAA